MSRYEDFQACVEGISGSRDPGQIGRDEDWCWG